MRISDWSSYVCSADLFRALVRNIEFEEFKIGSIPAPDPLGYRCGGRMQVDIVLQPCPFEWPDLIGEEAFAPQHVDEEVNGLFQIGHRQANVFDTAQTRYLGLGDRHKRNCTSQYEKHWPNEFGDSHVRIPLVSDRFLLQPVRQLLTHDCGPIKHFPYSPQ